MENGSGEAGEAQGIGGYNKSKGRECKTVERKNSLRGCKVGKKKKKKGEEGEENEPHLCELRTLAKYHQV